MGDRAQSFPISDITYGLDPRFINKFHPEQVWQNGDPIDKRPPWRPKEASQGDKPSPNAAQAVLEALKTGNESEAKELLKTTDCPEGCETHPEGKCNHQYMSAGRTRVRYLINDSSFDKDPEESDFGTTDHESPALVESVDEAVDQDSSES